jgi:hypothetical protein
VNDLWVRVERNDCRVLPISLVLIHFARALGLVMACSWMPRAVSWQETMRGVMWGNQARG